MYRKILVPLDGSAIAETVLPHVLEMAGGSHYEKVILLRVISVDMIQIPKSYARSFDFRALKKAQHSEAQAYLDDVKSRLRSNGIDRVETEIMEGVAAEAIVDYANETAIDLIVIATHGYTGMKRMMLGSVAYRVLNESHVPVLLCRPESCRP